MSGKHVNVKESCRIVCTVMILNNIEFDIH